MFGNQKIIVFMIMSFLFIAILISPLAYGQTESGQGNEQAQVLQEETPEFAGELFGQPVPMGNYYFAKRVVQTFSAKWRGTPKTMEELEDLTWQELVFSFEAFRRGIEAAPDEIDNEIEKILKANKVEFSFRTDKEEFQKWTKENIGVPIEYFRNQMEHLVKLEKLRKETLESFEPEVTDEEAYQKFLDEYNSLSVELIRIDDLDQAKDFYQKAIKPVLKQELDELVWQDLLLSHEAFKRNMEIEDKDTDRAIELMLRENKVNFRWKENEEEFAKWIQERIGVTKDIFRQQITQLVKIDKLREKIFSGEQQPADQDKAYQEFLTAAGTIDAAYQKFIENYGVQKDSVLWFEALDAAKEYYKKIDRNAGFWEESKRQQPQEFKRPGFVALDFLINMWGFKKEDAYKMMDEEPDAFYPPSPIYKGYGVFKIREIRKADLSKYEERKDYYFNRVKMIKQYEDYKKWVEDFKEQANITVFIK